MQTVQMKADFISEKMEEQLTQTLNNGKEILCQALVNFEVEFGQIDDSLFQCQRLLEEVACLLVNPEISGKLDEHSKKYGGKYLLKMINFFRDIAFQENVEAYFAHYRLKYCGEGASQANLDLLELIYVTKTN